MIWIFLFFVVIFALVAISQSANSKREHLGDEQEFRMSQDPEYKAFIENKRAVEAAEMKKQSVNSWIGLGILLLACIAFFIWYTGLQ